VAQEVSDGVKSLVELPSAKEAAEEIKSLKIDYANLIKAGKSSDSKAVGVTADDFPHIPAEAYKPNLFSLEKARLHCRLQMVRIVKEVCENGINLLGFECFLDSSSLTLYVYPG
jgi:hypothetical protein